MGKEDSAVGYVLVKKDAGTHEVLKIDWEAGAVVSRYTIVDGKCSCKGFEFRGECRHIGMVYDRPKPCPRSAARKVASEVIRELEPFFERVVFGEYVFVDQEEDAVKEVIIQAYGKPSVFDGVTCRKIVGVRTGVQVKIEVNDVA